MALQHAFTSFPQPLTLTLTPPLANCMAATRAFIYMVSVAQSHPGMPKQVI